MDKIDNILDPYGVIYVLKWIENNSHLFKGKDGKNPSTYEIKNAISNYMDENKSFFTGKDGQSIKGERGQDGLNGVGISDITYKNGTLTVTLSDGTKKNIKLNIPTQYIGGGGGVSAEYVDNAIAEAIGGGVSGDYYTKIETDTLISEAQNLFIQDTQPTQTAPYMWVQTFINGDLTFWIEDGK